MLEDWSLLKVENFKEDSVREFIIMPLLKKLGFVLKDSTKQKENTKPTLEAQLSLRGRAKLQVGSNKQLETDFMPDYMLFVDSKIHCIFDAKSPSESITKESKNYQQVLLYATHFKSPYFALCNGFELRLFAIARQEVLLEIALKDELDSILSKSNGEKIFQADVTNLREIQSESIDFIIDPPYGAKIPYLDLSTMWNVWFDLPVDRDLKERECIKKGSLEKSSDEYQELMTKSLKEMIECLNIIVILPLSSNIKTQSFFKSL